MATTVIMVVVDVVFDVSFLSIFFLIIVCHHHQYCYCS